jgi:LysM repeat protein
MRFRILLLTLATAFLILPASASADYGHVVAPGETLTSVAAADGLSVSALAAANGLSTGSQLVAGSVLQIPPQNGVAAPVAASSSTASTATESDADAAPDGDEGAPATSVGGAAYVVAPGDTLSSIAAAHGMTVAQLAAANGLDPAGVLLAGSTLNFGGASSSAPTASAGTAQPVSSTLATSSGAQPTPETVSPSEVGQIAAANGVPSSLAEAIGYQESGFNNDLVSPTGATGVMQIEPGTWKYIGQNLATPPPLSPYSAQDNIRGGVLLLRSLLDSTGGNSAMAAAGYYQGLQSVQQHGMYSDTRQYVGDVMSLQSQFGGG